MPAAAQGMPESVEILGLSPLTKVPLYKQGGEIYYHCMKILNITAQRPDSTGSGVYLAEMVKAFSRLGHQQAVIAGITSDEESPFSEDVLFCPVYYETEQLPYPVLGMSDEMPYRATRYGDMTPLMVEQLRDAFESALRTTLKEFNPDVVICHHLYLVTSFIRSLLPDKQIVAVCHGTDLRQMQKHDLERDFIVNAIQDLDEVFALHEVQKEEIAKLYGVKNEKIRVIGTGFNHKRFHDEGRAEQQGKAGEIVLTYVGKLWEKKGVKSLIRALDLLPYEPKELVLNLIGGYSHQKEYDSICALAEKSRFSIRFRGKLSQDKVAEAYRSSDLFILPSFFEGLPLVVVEALACGCKVVMTDLPGIRPWLLEKVPDASIVYVAPPEMIHADEPKSESIPQFEQNLADAIVQSIEQPYHRADMYGLTWESLCCSVLLYLKN